MAVIEVTMQEIQKLVQEGTNGNMDSLNKAEALINQILNRQPDNWVALFYYANIKLFRGLSGIAITVLKKCFDMESSLAEIPNNIGTAYRREHFHEEAEEWFLKSLEINPNDADIYNNLSTLHINEGSPQEAINYLQKALEIQPHNKHAHWNAVLAYLELENWEQGFKDYVW
ncbi:MAG: tetratricopeptide repeat protein, partial [Halobacteria archaeon]|nr:tetratricopeptide repeat protein [Halobacteria archaeon]